MRNQIKSAKEIIKKFGSTQSSRLGLTEEYTRYFSTVAFYEIEHLTAYEFKIARALFEYCSTCNISPEKTFMLNTAGYDLSYYEIHNSFNLAAMTLRQDITSRQAVINFPKNNCIVSMQFLVRKNKLESLVFFRSLDVNSKMATDLGMLMMLHKLMADKLGVDIGVMKYVVGSLHEYVKE